MKLIIYDDWEKLVDNSGSVLIEGHKIEAEDLLRVLGYDFEVEYIEED